MSTKVIDQESGADWSLYNADCVDLMRQMPACSVDLSIYSPPFSTLYTYSESVCDMGNTATDSEFLEQYAFAARELYRVTRPGRIAAVHCKQLVNYQNRDGRSGWRDFRGDLIRAHEAQGWQYHSEIVIWKCPVIEMQRTKTQRLLYKTLRTDASLTGIGMPEYLLLFRRWPENDEEQVAQMPIEHPVGDEGSEIPLDVWQQWASPVWMDIRQTNVLNVKEARGDKDEKHLCPLQLDLIKRAIYMWSNRGEVVFSPFAGIGSEGVVSLELGRKFVGTELHSKYFAQAKRNLADAERQASSPSLFDWAKEAAQA